MMDMGIIIVKKLQSHSPRPPIAPYWEVKLRPAEATQNYLCTAAVSVGLSSYRFSSLIVRYGWRTIFDNPDAAGRKDLLLLRALS